MSLYLPAALTQADLDIIQAPYDGGEFEVYFSHTSAKIIGSIAMSAAAAGVYTDNAATTLSAGGAHLQLVCTTDLRSTVNTVVTFGVTNNETPPAATTSVATFAPPAWVTDQSKNFQHGIATDLLTVLGDDETEKKITIVGSLNSIAGGAKNVSFDLYELPALTDYALIGCTTDVDFTDPSRKGQPIDCGMRANAFIKRGKNVAGELNIGTKFKGAAAGITRFSGKKVTVRMDGIKDGVATGDRYVFTQYVPTIRTRLPDGEGEAMADSQGPYNELLMFFAPYTP